VTGGEIKGGEIQGFRSLEFDLPAALLQQIVAEFEAMEAALLLPNHTSEIPDAQGVYQLYHAGKLVYVGKTDGNAGLRRRLSRHAWTIKSRHNLDVADVAFKAVQVLVFSAMDLETALIAHYRELRQPPAWNGSGFGNNDPGRERDTTAVRPDSFDGLYPINIDDEILVDWVLGESALQVLAHLNASVPYRIRHMRTREAIAQLQTSEVKPLAQPTTARRVIEAVCNALPPGWQGTRLSGRIILYREAKNDYPSAEVIARS
jgi:hypothetical protein